MIMYEISVPFPTDYYYVTIKFHPRIEEISYASLYINSKIANMIQHERNNDTSHFWTITCFNNNFEIIHEYRFFDPAYIRTRFDNENIKYEDYSIKISDDASYYSLYYIKYSIKTKDDLTIINDPNKEIIWLNDQNQVLFESLMYGQLWGMMTTTKTIKDDKSSLETSGWILASKVSTLNSYVS